MLDQIQLQLRQSVDLEITSSYGRMKLCTHSMNVFLVVDKHLLPLSAISCIVTYEWIVRKYFLNLYLSEDSEFVKNMKNIKPKRIRKYKNAID